MAHGRPGWIFLSWVLDHFNRGRELAVSLYGRFINEIIKYPLVNCPGKVVRDLESQAPIYIF